MPLLHNVERLLYEEQQANVDMSGIRADWRRFERGNSFESMTEYSCACADVWISRALNELIHSIQMYKLETWKIKHKLPRKNC